MVDCSLSTRTIAVLECIGTLCEPFVTWKEDHAEIWNDLLRWLVIPLLHTITKDDAEASHKLAIKVLASGLSPVDTKADQEDILGFDVRLSTFTSWL